VARKEEEGKKRGKERKKEKIWPCSKGEIKIATEESKKDDGI